MADGEVGLARLSGRCFLLGFQAVDLSYVLAMGFIYWLPCRVPKIMLSLIIDLDSWFIVFLNVLRVFLRAFISQLGQLFTVDPRLTSFL